MCSDHQQSPRRRISPRDFITNMDAPMPLSRKLWLLTRNLSLRAVRLQPCCGHPGEPGC